MVNFTNPRPPILTVEIKTKLDSMELVSKYAHYNVNKKIIKKNI